MTISRSFALYVVMLGLVLMGSASAWSQTDFHIKVYATDETGWTDSVYLGKYAAATDAVGDSLSPVLNETELPPLPPDGANQAPDLRVISPSGDTSYGQGVRVDLRNLVSDGQKNTYRLKFRRTDPAPPLTGITLSWDAGLDAVSGGGFYLTDGFGGVLWGPINMAEQTSFTFGGWSGLPGGFCDIVIGDGSMHRTFTSSEIALGLDSKGKKGKFEKAKPISVDFEFTLTATGGETSLFLAFDKIVNGTVSFSSDPDGHLPQAITALKAYTVALSPALQAGVVVHVAGNGIKGKAMKGKTGFAPANTKAVTAFVVNVYEYLRLPAPNVNNIGNEVYLNPGNLSIGIGTGVGLPAKIGQNAKLKDIIHHISLPKWKDVSKTLYKFKNVDILMGDPLAPAFCLDTINSKENIKMLKSIGPDKMRRVKDVGTPGNRLIAELIALKFNMGISEFEHTPATGFRDLVYKGTAGPTNYFQGRSVDNIADHADYALACYDGPAPDTSGLPVGWTATDMADFLTTLNAEFSGDFDTVSWSGIKTVATGIKPVVLSTIFTNSGPSNAPVSTPVDYSSLYNVPSTFALSQNYPNPFNPTTTIEFSIPEDAAVTLRVFNMLGQVVATLADHEEFGSGENSIDFDATKLSSGVYFYRIDVNDGQFKDIHKMVLMK